MADFEQPIPGLAVTAPILLAVAASGVYLSSLVDWYIILPRISGLLGPRPCRDRDERFVAFPSTWRSTTQWWYIHRIASALLLRFGLSLAVVIAIGESLGVPFGADVVAGALVGGFATYIAAVPRAFREAGNPAMIVGQTVHAPTYAPRDVESRFARLITRLPLIGHKPGPLGPREYVYDVALEGVKVVEANPREGKVLNNGRPRPVKFQREARSVELRDVRTSKPGDPDFHGCKGRCSGISWYCIENPDCFKSK